MNPTANSVVRAADTGAAPMVWTLLCYCCCCYWWWWYEMYYFFSILQAPPLPHGPPPRPASALPSSARGRADKLQLSLTARESRPESARKPRPEVYAPLSPPPNPGSRTARPSTAPPAAATVVENNPLSPLQMASPRWLELARPATARVERVWVFDHYQVLCALASSQQSVCVSLFAERDFESLWWLFELFVRTQGGEIRFWRRTDSILGARTGCLFSFTVTSSSDFVCIFAHDELFWFRLQKDLEAFSKKRIEDRLRGPPLYVLL